MLRNRCGGCAYFDPRLHGADVVGDVAVGGEDVEPAVEVVVEEEAGEGQRQQRRLADGRGRRFVDEEAFPLVLVKGNHLVGEVADHQAWPAGAVVVGGVDAHAGARDARFVERHARGDGDVGEGAVLLVLVEPVRLGVVGDEQIEPAVAVVIEQRDAERLRGRVVETGLLRRVLEPAIAEVAIERRALTFVRLGRAVRLRLAVERAVQVFLDRPVDVVGDEQIEAAVAVVVEPRGAGREPGVADTGRVGDVGEAQAAKVAEQAILAERGDVEIGPAVVVVVGGRGAKAVERNPEARGGRDVGERAVAIVPVEREQ